MTTIIPTRRGRRRTEPPKVLLPVKMTEAQRTRFKVACAEEGLSYAALVLSLLDERDRRKERARARQAHPFHRPAPEAAAEP